MAVQISLASQSGIYSCVFTAKSGRSGFAVSISFGEFTLIPEKQFPYWDIQKDSFALGVANPNKTCYPPLTNF